LVLDVTSPGQFEVADSPLDFMSMVGWITAEIPDEGDTSLALEFGFGHLGLLTPEDDMPTEGEASYDGIFEGIYVVPGVDEEGFIGDATGFVDLTADFGAGAVDGSVHDITVEGSEAGGNIDFVDVTIGGEPAAGFDGDSIAGNIFSGNVVPGEGGFAGFDEVSIGTAVGFFYGPNNVVLNGPEEVGAVLTLENADGSGDFISGVIGANVVD
jgi:hypothetical protein